MYGATFYGMQKVFWGLFVILSLYKSFPMEYLFNMRHCLVDFYQIEALGLNWPTL
jgi:hypothetical protein